MSGHERRALALALYGPGCSLWTTPQFEDGQACLLALPDGRGFIGRTWARCFALAGIHAEKVGGRDGLARRAAEPAPSIEESASAVMTMLERAS